MHSLPAKLAILVANVFIIASLLVFAKGFFPHKASLPGFAQWPVSSAASSRAAPFDRVVFMVVDALRSDFVYGNSTGFKFTQSLIRNGAAIPFTGYASPPTITMPRVKAITTGSVPSFVDLVLNFAESDTSSTLKDQDSWLAQLKAKGGKLVMYGDDTWLRLFPGFFERSDGTTSFFVSDFTEVDNNITRHIPAELENDDWSAMTLHFLGLDHIGHKTGPRGPNMPAKQAEMDGIVRDIYTAIESTGHLESCLLVLLGDHGMNEGGNHGASSPGEVSTALTFISPKFKAAFEGQTSPINDAIDYRFYDIAQQSDIAPTLAALLGFPVPQNNLGVVIPRLLELWTVQKDQYDLLYENAEQIKHIAQATFPNHFKQVVSSESCSTNTGDDATALACLWYWVSQNHSRSSTVGPNLDAIADLRAFLQKAQDVLSGTASNYDLISMYVGLGLAAAGFLCCLPPFVRGAFEAGADGLFLIFVMVSYAVTMFASSYVEEEQQFWYWVLGGWLIVLYLKGSRFSSSETHSGTLALFPAYVLLGIIRRWRQTGQKYAGDPDLITEIIAPNSWFLWILVSLTYALPSRNLSARAAKWMGSPQMGLLPVLVTISAFLFKIAFTAADAPELLRDFPMLNPMVGFVSRYPLLKLAQVVFLGLTHLGACSIYYESPWKDVEHFKSFLKVFQDVLTIFLVTQSRTVFVPLFLFFHLQLNFLRRARAYSVGEVTVMALLFQYASFFVLGGTNSIATIDLSNAYNGISGYNVLAVGILTFISNWTGPIWWAFGTCQLLSNSDLIKGSWAFLLTSLTTFACVHTLSVMVACTMLREHLFIWTVFSPKYLYTAAWVVGQHTFINTIIVGAVLWRGGKGKTT
ncbi:uncharacterized protein A1O9_02681 [Exophiala aquamarina CBS 119918]|uniref:GPI ethanolamine phosphate transferase 2 n=1 Tax=Exophiala aquamarina CBS 119918 TaxID=1182545 RepID=A0A072PML0_9EURO|nr:uncharacterized protein A1O9_02681 [Exophiala aquamarina CBS 119918]KEF61116.1 hypothetical protein A1O9_02681 [Exophiala aquamarina CBS 119918]